MFQVQYIYRLKEGTGELNHYLGDKIYKVKIEKGRIFWCMSSEDYVTNKINNLEETLDKDILSPLKFFGNKYGKQPFPLS